MPARGCDAIAGYAYDEIASYNYEDNMIRLDRETNLNYYLQA